MRVHLIHGHMPKATHPAGPVAAALPTQVMTALAPRAFNPNKRTPDDVWNEMRKSFQAAKTQGLHLTFQWKLSGKDGGHWYLKIDDGKLTIAEGDAPEKANVTFECSAETWVALSNKKLGGMAAYLSGRLSVRGSHATAKKLDTIFPN